MFEIQPVLIAIETTNLLTHLLTICVDTLTESRPVCNVIKDKLKI